RQVLQTPHRPGPCVMAQPVKIDHVNAPTPLRQHCFRIFPRNEKVAEVQVLVKTAKVMQKASEAGNFLDQTPFPTLKTLRRQSLGGARNRLVEGQHPVQLFDDEHALQAAAWADELAAGNHLRYGQSVGASPEEAAHLLKSGRPVTPGPKRRQETSPP